MANVKLAAATSGSTHRPTRESQDNADGTTWKAEFMSALLVRKTFTKDTSHIGSNSQGYAVLLSWSRTWNQSEKDTILVNLDDEQEITQLPEQMHTIAETKKTMHLRSINTLTMRKTQTTLRHCVRPRKQKTQQ